MTKMKMTTAHPLLHAQPRASRMARSSPNASTQTSLAPAQVRDASLSRV